MRSRHSLRAACLFAVTLVAFGTTLRSAELRVLPASQAPADVRLEPLKDLNGYFPFVPPSDPAEWSVRAESLRRRMKVAIGLWPMPTRTALNAVIHGRMDLGDYTVEKVYFESMPGFFVTGSLYRPKGQSDQRRPGILCPHGHWSNGRFYDNGEAAVRKEIERGAERFEVGGRSALQCRCVQLARMGAVVFPYDMIGYAVSRQLSQGLAHGFSRQRPQMNSEENWGLFSPQAEARLQSVMGLQTYSSIRALDFLMTLPDVDGSRLAVTGASGGGTQTFMVCALDVRPRVAFPAVMVSTAMQGGCTCENSSLLRVEVGNVEIAALFAPRALGLTAADDWTKEMETKGFPELQKHYSVLGVPDRVMLKAALQFGHNYNRVGRLAMYGWMNRHLEMGVPEPIEEKDYRRLTREEMTVWDDAHPVPEGGADFERRLLRSWDEDARRQLDAVRPVSTYTLGKYRELVGGGVDAILGRSLPDPKQLRYDQKIEEARDGYRVLAGLLRNEKLREELPILSLYPEPWQGHVVIWIDPRGKAGLLGDDGKPVAAVAKLLKAGVAVVGVDLLYQGEFLVDGKEITRTRRVANRREAAAYTFGYNHTLFARRVHDVLTVISFVKNHKSFVKNEENTPKRVSLVGLKGAGPWVAAARAQAGTAVNRAAIHTGGFRFSSVRDLHDVNFLPGGARYHDLPGMLSLSVPQELWIAGEGEEAPVIVRAAYDAAGASTALSTFDGEEGELAEAAVAWILRPEARTRRRTRTRRARSRL